MKITLPIYFQKSKLRKVLLGVNWYRNAHYFETSKAKSWYKDLVIEECASYPPFFGTIHVHYDIYIKNVLTDGGNVRSIVEKFFLDGLVEAGVIPNDTNKIVVSDSSNYYIDKENPRAEITVKENG